MTETPGHNVIGALRSYVERIESLEAERAELASAIREEKKAVKASLGIETAILNKVLKIRATDPEKRIYEKQEIARLMDALDGGANG